MIHSIVDSGIDALADGLEGSEPLDLPGLDLHAGDPGFGRTLPTPMDELLNGTFLTFHNDLNRSILEVPRCPSKAEDKSLVDSTFAIPYALYVTGDPEETIDQCHCDSKLDPGKDPFRV